MPSLQVGGVTTGIAAAVAMAAILLLATPRARACSPPASGVTRLAVVPQDGALGVPTNAEIRLYHSYADLGIGGPPDLPHDPMLRT